MRRNPDSGVVLVNVLVILTVASAVVYLMLGSQETALERTGGLADAVDAELLALGAEASVVAALRRDLETAPEADHFAEDWTAVLQEETVLRTGRFSVSVTDVQGKYDINRLAQSGIAPVLVIERLLQALDQPPELAAFIASALRRAGPVRQLSDLRAFGVPQPALDALAAHVTALPVVGTVNLNTADPLLLRAMLNNRAIAARLLAVRAREGQITREALAGAGAVRPDHSGFTSNVFDVGILAAAGSASLRLESRILRTNDLSGRAVGVISRRFLPTDASDRDR